MVMVDEPSDGRTPMNASDFRFGSPGMAQLRPYVPGEQPPGPGWVKLNTNENPYAPSPKVAEAIAQAVAEGLHLYPDPASCALRERIARRQGVAPEEVFVGNGSDEVLAHALYAFFRRPLPLLMPDVTYSFYRVHCGLHGISRVEIPVDRALSIRVEDFLGVPAGGIVLANPNAPTGRHLPRAAIERLLQAHPDSVVLVDEAYVDFGGESCVPLVARYPNLLVVRTFSKGFALAGLRVGYGIGQAHLIDTLERVKASFNSYPLDRLAQAGAAAALDDVEWFERTRGWIMQTRTWLRNELAQLGFDAPASQANFLFVRHPRCKAADVAAGLRRRRVLVRHFPEARIDQHLRISVGTAEQASILRHELSDVLREMGC
jgi:histidinol-phosphate aminotransferase